MRSGIIGRCDNTGLGNLTWEFYNHLKPDKTLIAVSRYESYRDRYPGAKFICGRNIDNEAIREFLKGLDIFLCFETPYNWDIFNLARESKVKSAMIPMYEYLNETSPRPDLYICPSKIDYDAAKGNKVFLPVPVNREALERRRPEEAKTFLFNAGHGGTLGRNSSPEFLEALPMTRKDLNFIIHTQKKNLECSRAKVVREDVKNYWDLWKEGDVFVMPHKFAGLSLPVQEAMATGLPVITTDFYPFNEFMPKELLISPESSAKARICREIDVYRVTPRQIADKINEVAGWPGEKIGELSDRMDEYAESISWKNLLPKYEEVLKNL